MKDKPLKVMHVIEDLESGGAERVVVELTRGLNAQHFSPMVCCLRKKGALAAELEQHGIPVFVMNKRSKIDLAMLWRLTRLLRSQKIAIVHCHVFTANLWGRLAALLARVPAIVTHEHSSISVDRQAVHRLERLLSRGTDAVITVTEQLAQRWRDEIGVSAQNVRTVYNGLDVVHHLTDPAAVRKLRSEFGLQKCGHVIGAVGRLEWRKNFKLLLEALAIVLHSHPNTTLMIVGAGEEETALKAHAVELKIAQNVIFAGYRADIAEMLGLFSVFCMSSDTEGISLALLEAITAGVPVVATRVGGTPEVIRDESMGTLVPPRNADALAHAVKAVLDHPQAAQHKAQTARQKVAEIFTKEKMIREIEMLYREIIRARKWLS